MVLNTFAISIVISFHTETQGRQYVQRMSSYYLYENPKDNWVTD